WRWVGEIELSGLVTLVVALAGIWLLATIADSVVGQDPRYLDRQILLALREQDDPAEPIGPEWLEVSMRDVTALGGSMVMGLLTLSVAGYLLLRRQYHLVILVVVTIAGAAILTQGLKSAYARPRPELVPGLTGVLYASFPSGHSSGAAAVYLTLGSLVARLQRRRVIEGYVIGLAVVLTLLVGFSRVYLGVHYPSDVVAGWILGAVWAMVTLFVARLWDARRRPVTDAPPKPPKS
ncbi:MAG TPA: phosphatase PAP2 family protein, partial [Anaerolineae bacterium]|nr:phosphatase PAP2 family protein [Anaerolineae bacterium]